MKTKVFIKVLLLLFAAGSFQLVNAQLPVAEYQPGTAILSGSITNFNPEQNLDIRCAAPNIIMLKTEPYFIEPDSSGHFRQEIKLKYTTQVRLKIGKHDLFLLMSPDRQTYHVDIEANEKGENMPISFSGPYAAINQDFNFKLKPIQTDLFAVSTCELTPDQYKEMCLNDLSDINRQNESNPDACPEAKRLMKLTNSFNCLSNLKICKYAMIYSRMQRDSLQRMVAFGLYKDFRLPDNYYDFLKDMPLNEPEARLCYEFSGAIPFPGDFKTYQDEDEYENYILANAPMNDDERDLIKDYMQKRYLSDNYEKINEVMSVNMKYQYIFQKRREEELSELKERLPRLTGLEHPAITEFADIRFARFQMMDFKPLTVEQEMYYEQNLTDPLCIALLNDANNDMKPRKKVQTKTNFLVRENPDCPADKVLDAIIEKNKGKIQFIDLWATWCGGCRQTIKEYEPLKKEYPDVVFIYLTNESSPLELWNKLINDISGEHYRLETAQWNYFWKRFELIGVPFYLIINKEGKIADQFTYTNKTEVNKKLKELVNH